MPRRKHASDTERFWDLTLDVCVLMSAWQRGTTQQKKPCLDLTRRIADNEDCFLALDTKQRILTQYQRRNPNDAPRWLQHLASRNKIMLVDPKPLKRADDEKLGKARFGGKNYKEDVKYVEVARATACHVVVSHDAHFRNAKDILKTKSIGVDVRSPQEALDLTSP